jgi:hypothetical protein
VSQFWDRAYQFAAAPSHPRPLAALRIGLSAVLLAQAFSLAGDLETLYGELGVVQWEVMDPRDGSSAVPAGVPRVRWFSDAVAPLGVSVPTATRCVFVLYATSLALLLVGWRTAFTAAAAWILHLSLNSASPMGVYGVDQFANIGLFYCFVMPVGHCWSIDASRNPNLASPSSAATIGLRVLQIHLCIVYLTSGVEKASGLQWWDGEAIWRAVNLPELQTPFEFGWLAQLPWLAAALAWGTLFIEIGYAFFVWNRATRPYIAVATILLHLGIAVAMGLLSFAAVMIVLTTSAFLVPSATTATTTSFLASFKRLPASLAVAR